MPRSARRRLSAPAGSRRRRACGSGSTRRSAGRRAITQRTLAWFPVRVWRHFLQHNGFLLAAGVSYQALFATLRRHLRRVRDRRTVARRQRGGRHRAHRPHQQLHPRPDQRRRAVSRPRAGQAIASQQRRCARLTGIIALGTLIWTAIGFVTFSRRAVRDIFGLPPDRRSYFLPQGTRPRRRGASSALALVVGSPRRRSARGRSTRSSRCSAGATRSRWVSATASVGSILIGVRRSLARRWPGSSGSSRARSSPGGAIWPGALLGGSAISSCSSVAGWLLRLHAVQPAAGDVRDLHRAAAVVPPHRHRHARRRRMDRGRREGPTTSPLLPQTEAERLAAEHAALLVAARVRLRTAQEAQRDRAVVPRWSPRTARYGTRRRSCAQVEAATPPAPKKTGILAEPASTDVSAVADRLAVVSRRVRIASVNVNGIRAATRKGMIDWLDAADVDVMALQEVRATEEELRGGSARLGDRQRRGPREGTGGRRRGQPHPARSRCAACWARPPRTRLESSTRRPLDRGRLRHRRRAAHRRERLRAHRRGRHAQAGREVGLPRRDGEADAAARGRVAARRSIMGDLNVGHREFDIRNWKGNVKKAGFLPRERAYFDRFFGDGGRRGHRCRRLDRAPVSAGSTSGAASTATSTARTPGGRCAGARSTTTPGGASTTTWRRPALARARRRLPRRARAVLGHPVERPLPRRRGLHDRRLTAGPDGGAGCAPAPRRGRRHPFNRLVG